MSDEAKTWWRADLLLGTVTSHEVVKVTPKMVVWLGGGRRSLRFTNTDRWFDNERDAVECLRTRLAFRVKTARAQLARAETALADFNAAHPED